jgi:tetratricopeptide (TPR) repeat protein
VLNGRTTLVQGGAAVLEVVAMDYRALVARIRDAVDAEAYFTPADHVDPRHREAVGEIAAALRVPGFDPDVVRRHAARLRTEGRLDDVLYWSSMHVISAHPAVSDWAAAATAVAMQEDAALTAGGPRQSDHMASVHRHRGVLAFLRGRYDVALEYFGQAFERQRTAENLTNILCTLIRLGDEHDARGLLDRVRAGMPAAMVAEIDRSIASDADLAPLRDEELPAC